MEKMVEVLSAFDRFRCLWNSCEYDVTFHRVSNPSAPWDETWTVRVYHEVKGQITLTKRTIDPFMASVVTSDSLPFDHTFLEVGTKRLLTLLHDWDTLLHSPFSLVRPGLVNQDKYRIMTDCFQQAGYGPAATYDQLPMRFDELQSFYLLVRDQEQLNRVFTQMKQSDEAFLAYKRSDCSVTYCINQTGTRSLSGTISTYAFGLTCRLIRTFFPTGLVYVDHSLGMCLDFSDPNGAHHVVNQFYEKVKKEQHIRNRLAYPKVHFNQFMEGTPLQPLADTIYHTLRRVYSGHEIEQRAVAFPRTEPGYLSDFPFVTWTSLWGIRILTNTHTSQTIVTGTHKETVMVMERWIKEWIEGEPSIWMDCWGPRTRHACMNGIHVNLEQWKIRTHTLVLEEMKRHLQDAAAITSYEQEQEAYFNKTFMFDTGIGGNR